MTRIPVVRLIEEEVALAKRIARLRFEKNREAGVHDSFPGEPEPKIATDARAIGAEMAVARYLNLYWSPTWVPPGTNGRKYPWDLKIAGLTIDVKFSNNGLRMTIPVWNTEPDVFVGVHGQPPIYKIAGWSRQADCIRATLFHKGAEGYPDYYAIPLDELIPIDDLIVAAHLKGLEHDTENR